MSADYDTMIGLYDRLGEDTHAFADSGVAHVIIHENKVLGANLVPGLDVRTEQMQDGVAIKILVEEGARIERKVHMCFGVIPEDGLQRILIDADIGDHSSIDILAHCMFPNALDVTHKMDADIRVGKAATYRYFERHVHGEAGGVNVLPDAKVRLQPDAEFETEFELVEGRVGRIEINYETWCAARSSLKMTARIAGSEDDTIKINEIGHLEGREATGVLLSRVSVADDAAAEIYNELTASAPHARGHVDCKEIVRDNATAKAVPVVDVRHPLARVTHEASIGSVDSKQLQTLLIRGMDEEKAVEMIVNGLLKG